MTPSTGITFKNGLPALAAHEPLPGWSESYEMMPTSDFLAAEFDRLHRRQPRVTGRVFIGLVEDTVIADLLGDRQIHS